MLSSFYLILERHGQTDGRTELLCQSSSQVIQLMRDKNENISSAGKDAGTPQSARHFHTTDKHALHPRDLYIQSFLSKQANKII